MIEILVFEGNYYDNEQDTLYINDKTYKQLKDSYNNAINEYKSEAFRLADNIVGKYGDVTIKGLSDYNKLKYRELVEYLLMANDGSYATAYLTEDEKLGRY